MKLTGYYLLVGVLTGIAFLIHLIRAIMGWDLIIGTWYAPIWLSWILFIIAGFASLKSFKLAFKKG